MGKLHPLIEHLLDHGRDKSWVDLAKEFSISPDKHDIGRGNTAYEMWRHFKNSCKARNIDLTTVKEIYDKHGALQWRTDKFVPESKNPDISGMDIYKVTTNPYGGEWIKYSKRENKGGLSNDDIKNLQDSFSLSSFTPSITSGTGIGVVDISDIHSGAIVKVLSETLKQRQFDHDVLIKYIDNAIEIINSYGFAEVYLFLPGDIIESFTGFNHRDTWKTIQHYEGQMVIIGYEVVKRLLSGIKNIRKVYMVEGNHDRMTAEKSDNTRKGVVEVIAHFLQEGHSIPIVYHPFLVQAEIDNIYHVCTHGDFKPWGNKVKGAGYDGFFFKYGKQGMYNVMRTGHYHQFNMIAANQDFMHYQCGSIFTGGLFEEFLGFNTLPGITILRNYNDICSVEFRPVIGYKV